ncbi:reverse transcriptase domain-containing protein [Escherichia coli]|uniref:reverse transcriptase domain-containing protein n=1 Tax=Escherichia coli TaxID=562 RepID=UPI0021C73F67|nr:reverse transcriptase domain-containing protein [Escherichia coli]
MRSTADAIEQVFNACGKKASAEWILEGDIRGCFDNLSHEWLLSHIPMDRMVLRNWLKSGYCEGMSFYPTKGGTPQGGIISPTLMNMALDGLQSGDFHPQRYRAVRLRYIWFGMQTILS